MNGPQAKTPDTRRAAHKHTNTRHVTLQTSTPGCQTTNLTVSRGMSDTGMGQLHYQWIQVPNHHIVGVDGVIGHLFAVEEIQCLQKL